MASPSPPALDLNNVQGDILAGLPKKVQIFLFFQIDGARVHEFRTQLAKLVPLITTTVQVINDQKKIIHHKTSVASKYGTQEHLKTSDEQENLTPELLEMSGINLAFSKKGLEKMGLVDPDPQKDTIGDPAFTGGMFADASNLGDQVSNWNPKFKDLDGLIMITGDRHSTVEKRLAEVKKIFLIGETNATIHQVLSVVGDVRPGHESGHEHFGFADGISQPAVQGLPTDPNPGHGTPVRQGIILLGRDGDNPKDPNDPTFTVRPPWTLDGSFLCFRLLLQRVPEFNAFLKHKATPDVHSDLLGARLVGRWKSGAPIDITPLRDDPHLAKDPSRNNNFRYDIEDPDKEERCPFAAHTRKTNPRSDLDAFGGTEVRRIIRRGIPFGREVSREEAALNKTFHDRGLLFVAYQSNIGNGFRFIQTKWANNPTFPFPPKVFPPTVQAVVPGQDPIIGQTNNATPVMTGTDPKNPVTPLSLPNEAHQWVVSKGGEYFFSPSIPALKNTFALAA